MNYSQLLGSRYRHRLRLRKHDDQRIISEELYNGEERKTKDWTSDTLQCIVVKKKLDQGQLSTSDNDLCVDVVNKQSFPPPKVRNFFY